MNKLVTLILCATCIGGCSVFDEYANRTVTEKYVHSNLDTSHLTLVTGVPGAQTQAVDLVVKISNEVRPEIHVPVYTRRVSTVERKYPNFIRMGLFEGTGLLGSRIDGRNIGLGIFGAHPTMSVLDSNQRLGSPGGALVGSLWRLGIVEWPVNWFDAARGWSCGITLAEVFYADYDNEARGFGVITLRKRWFLNESIPWTDFMAGVSMSVVPYAMLHPHVSLGIGSIGGLNLRVNAGFPISRVNSEMPTITAFPYLGLAAGVFDFLNRPDELEQEWKDHSHSSWLASLFDLSYVLPVSGSNDIQSMDKQRGFNIRIATADVAFPLLDFHVTLGTSLVNILAFSEQRIGMGILPIRVGVVWDLFGTGVLFQPFGEYSYLPSTILNTGVNVFFDWSAVSPIVVTAGYAECTTVDDTYTGSPLFVDTRAYSGPYISVGIRLFSRTFTRDMLRYGEGE